MIMEGRANKLALGTEGPKSWAAAWVGKCPRGTLWVGDNEVHPKPNPK